MVDRQTRQMQRLVNDLLEVSGINRGRIALRPDRVDVTTAIRKSTVALEHERAQRGHARKAVLPPGPTPNLADPVRLAQVLENLLQNA